MSGSMDLTLLSNDSFPYSIVRVELNLVHCGSMLIYRLNCVDLSLELPGASNILRRITSYTTSFQ